MRLLDETWRCDGDEFVVGPYGSELDGPLLEMTSNTDEDIARARLAAAAPEMARLLLASPPFSVADCAWCGISKNVDHLPDCKLMAVLRKAGVAS